MKKLLSILASGVILCLSSLSAKALPLSPGDRIQVSIPDEKYFANVYEVNEKGNVEVPYIGELSVVGQEPSEVALLLKEVLIEKGYFLPGSLELSVEVILWAPILIGVSGDVHLPGTAIINGVAEDIEKTGVSDSAKQITGDFPVRRNLTNALRSAGGVRPTADVKNIKVIRGNQTMTFDLSGAFTGEPFRDIPLISGDQVLVPVSGRYSPEMVRPSRITPPGIKVIVSNLIVPALSNATAANSNRSEGITFVYGARFSHAVFAMNCVGGIKSTNARRRAILMRVDPDTGKTITLEKSIEDLIRNSDNDRDNPFLMRSDAVACYDSTVTNVRDVFRSLSDVFNPINILKNIIF